MIYICKFKWSKEPQPLHHVQDFLSSFVIRWSTHNRTLKELPQEILSVSIMEYFWDTER
jgi:hypothetical protein